MAKFLIQLTYSDSALAELVKHPEDEALRFRSGSHVWVERLRSSTTVLATTTPS